MAGNLDDGKYVTTSSLSLIGNSPAFSSATLRADYAYLSALSIAPGVLTVNAPGVSSWNQIAGGGTAIAPDLAIGSDTSLGLYRSTTSILAMSYGWFKANYISSATTDQSGATAKVVNQGQLYFSVLSLTSNGGEFGFRSGNTVYRFASTDVG